MRALVSSVSVMTEPKPEKLFVYGTLRKGGTRGEHLERCRLLRMIKVPGILYRTPFGYPAAVFDETSPLAVQGELYELPPDSEAFIGSVDRLEGADEKLFSRSAIRLGEEFFYAYEPGPELRSRIGDADIVKTGNWFSGPALCGEDPFSFAVSFENIQKQYYRMRPDGRSEENIFLEGTVPVLVTCPHSTAHTRMGKLKRHEFYNRRSRSRAASGSRLPPAFTRTGNRKQTPNYYDDCGFKAALGESSVREGNRSSCGHTRYWKREVRGPVSRRGGREGISSFGT